MSRSSERVFGALYRDGYPRVISYHALEIQLPDGRLEHSWAYTIAKQSDLVTGFDIPCLLGLLDRVEAGWGGGSSIGGAPRRSNGSRSYLDPDRVYELIEAEVARGGEPVSLSRARNGGPAVAPSSCPELACDDGSEDCDESLEAGQT
jgi:hypothetical protein